MEIPYWYLSGDAKKYLKDRRKRRRLFLDEINHYMKVAKVIYLTIELQEKKLMRSM